MIESDSGEYEFLTEAVRLSADLPYPTVEIGVRKGYGSATMMDAIVAYCPGKTHICVDPYGSILYPVKENVEPCRLDYTNDMFKECIRDLYDYAIGKPVELLFFKMTDEEFFEKFFIWVEVYDLEAKSFANYSAVHFDGPHTATDVLREVKWFHNRTVPGSCFVFDDIGEIDFFYTHKTVHDWLLEHGWNHLKTGVKKALYQKA